MEPSEALVYLTARLELHVRDDPLDVMREWGARFAGLRRGGEYDACRYLLQAAKAWPLPDHCRAIVLYSEGWLVDRQGYPDEAITLYRRLAELQFTN